MAGLKGYRPSVQNAKNHKERGTRARAQSQAEQELQQLDREMALYWLAHYPAYREIIRQRVDAAVRARVKVGADDSEAERSRQRRANYTPEKRAEIAAYDRERRMRKRRAAKDVDHLGPEIDPCG